MLHGPSGGQGVSASGELERLCDERLGAGEATRKDSEAVGVEGAPRGFEGDGAWRSPEDFGGGGINEVSEGVTESERWGDLFSCYAQ